MAGSRSGTDLGPNRHRDAVPRARNTRQVLGHQLGLSVSPVETPQSLRDIPLSIATGPDSSAFARRLPSEEPLTPTELGRPHRMHLGNNLKKESMARG